MLYATEKQVNFIKALSKERGVDLDLNFIDMSSHEASQIISDLLARAKLPSRVREACIPLSDLSMGVYRDVNDNVVRVIPSRTTGNLYGERWNGRVFVYTKGIVYRLVKRLEIDEVKEIGKAFGTCCVCARTLTNPESIDAGIGPICAMKY